MSFLAKYLFSGMRWFGKLFSLYHDLLDLCFPLKKINMHGLCKIIFVLILLFSGTRLYSQKNIRADISLNSEWRTVANDSNQNAYSGFEKVNFDDKSWKQVDVPHNWDAYEGYRRMKHGNRHGYAWYRKTFTIDQPVKGKRCFLFFEGVGSYATVWLNGNKVGYHAGGRTTFTLDVTDFISLKGPNVLSVRADHPAMINDLPWVCGGCSAEWGFSEGSQPMGVFRPVHLIVTSQVSIEPFGVHVWNDDQILEKKASLKIEAELKNYGQTTRKVSVINKITDHAGKLIASTTKNINLPANVDSVLSFEPPVIPNPHLWSITDPYLYQVVTEIEENKRVIDQVSTPYGIRCISWPIDRASGGNQFFLNGNPVFINGIAEYEHNLGQSHAFSNEQIIARMGQIRSAGFNAFRDGHQPHNLLYQQYLDQSGMLWWPQFAAHIWYDTPEFRANFKTLLTDWVKERRNSPSVILWGLENESSLPTGFAKECSELIRKMDPTTSSQRKITTCNGGTGTDWNVIQNWSGTYSGKPEDYGKELSRQLLNGEYGAWRSIDLHTEGPFQQNGPLSEDRMASLMESKIRLAESVKTNCCGQFLWLFSSHDNPGRVQNGEGLRELDRIGPVNYKGLFTPWVEPLDAYYLFRSNYTPSDKGSMVYIVSHTWPDRWVSPGARDSIIVYSNCDEVELFNDVNSLSLGRMKRQGLGSHFQWNNVSIKYNVLYAKGYVNGKEVVTDCIVLNHLPKSPKFSTLKNDGQSLTKPRSGYNYLYRVNCGGPDYIDGNGNTWMADVHKSQPGTWGSLSWTDDFPGLPAFYASQRRTFDPIIGTSDWKLFQTFRYGRDKLRYEFPVPDGEYNVELYFIEPWYGTGGGLDCAGWRTFDVAVNGSTVIKDLDIWKEAGHDKVLKKTVIAKVKGGNLTISFPKVISGQAVISAIAVATANSAVKPARPSPSVISNLQVVDHEKGWSVQSWMDTGDKQYENDTVTFSSLPSNLYGADWIRTGKTEWGTDKKVLATFTLLNDAEVFIGLNEKITSKPSWMETYSDTKTNIEGDLAGGTKFHVYSRPFFKGDTIALGNNGLDANKNAPMYTIAVCQATNLKQAYDLRPVLRYEAEAALLSGSGIAIDSMVKKRCVKIKDNGANSVGWDISLGLAATYSFRIRFINGSGKTVKGNLKIIAADGTLLHQGNVEFATTVEKWVNFETSSETSINAGKYKILLNVSAADKLYIDYLEIQ
jgi:beta-galactosidase